jgi:hypothetical protein
MMGKIAPPVIKSATQHELMWIIYLLSTESLHNAYLAEDKSGLATSCSPFAAFPSLPILGSEGADLGATFLGMGLAGLGGGA